MSVTFTYEVIRVDNKYKVMDVVYKREGFDDITVGVRLPLETETLSYVINQYAPINQWRIIETAFANNIIEGESGELTIDDVALTAFDLEAQIRALRNQKLLNTDWIFISDSRVPANVLEWEQYRQNLRDITDQPGFPDNVVWPEEPNLL